MKNCVIVSVLSLLLVSPVTWAFSSGLLSQQCGTGASLIPSHGPAPQASPFPYTISATGGMAQYAEGTPLTRE